MPDILSWVIMEPAVARLCICLGRSCPRQCYFSYDFLVIVIVIVTHFLSF